MKTAIEFHNWMLKNDKLEKWFHYTDEDMFRAFLEERGDL